jgi:hypothetical protein
LGMRPFKLRGNIGTAGVASDLAVNKDHRFLQPALALQRALLSTAHPGVQIIYGVPNPGGASVLKHVGYREFSTIHRYAKVLRITHYLQKSRKVDASVSLIGRLADHAFATVQAFSRRGNKRITQPMPTFDARFDELWNRTSSDSPALTVRDRRFLHWRYKEFPLRQYKTIGLLSEDNSTLLGYLIYYIENRSAICADLLVSGGPQDVASLISSWAAVAWDAGLASLSASCSDGSLAETLVRQGFSRRSILPPIKRDRTTRREHSKTLFTHEQHCDTDSRDTYGWYYTEGDSPY